jgi:phospholipid/cholesterol/gamma-HCH transport system substrate-binding protein
MNRAAIDLWVGIFVAMGIGALLFLSLRVGNLLTASNAPGYRLEARFDNIGGLKLRAPIKAAGVVVGRVERVQLDPATYEAVVTMRIDQGYTFTRDTIASINTSGLLGEVYIALDAGGDPKTLADGDRVGKTQSAVVLEKLISQFLFDKAQAGPAAAPASGAGAPK